ncbi:hypothetical protein DMB65_04375 [Flavobacterium cheongpyeongense]|uniref:N-acetyltransferase domain-containing protein n=1 Tax=Flavobacterium cheongpyeongense TaxID=2212651 RepID=A0A2V4BRV5_9FLAO|nr:GNAT family N-acetyltransferase [Flavobacterium cheongpyeongense]PXY41808.1 hypothetical protein DMB65_04375 [Flavobacterium cheongpyeongense]
MNEQFLIINFTPIENDLKTIEKWLFEEDKKSNSGFYGNFQTIKKSFEENRLVIVKREEKIVGFLVWIKGDLHIEIDILEIHPKHRREGIGEYFVNQISNHFIQKGFKALKLFCSPKESEKFWNSLGFIKFPNCFPSDPDLTYFKPLIEIKEVENKIDSENRIELWDVEPYEAKDKEPIWIWNFENPEFDLSVPILHPCNYKWKISVIKEGEVIKENQIRYFSSKNNRIEFTSFLFIESLKVM